jgi:uncharacterized damage-inducible protein DinB
MVYQRVPFSGDEKTSMLAALNRHRDAALWKLEGLDDEQLRRPMVPSGTSLLGTMKHMAWVEYWWFCETFGREMPVPDFDEDDPDAEFRIEPDETTADILALYDRARTAADQAAKEIELDELGTAWTGEKVSMRWVLIHMLEEDARHVGQMDVIRELIDGATGDHHREES